MKRHSVTAAVKYRDVIVNIPTESSPYRFIQNANSEYNNNTEMFYYYKDKQKWTVRETTGTSLRSLKRFNILPVL